MKSKYLPRIADSILEEKLQAFGAIYITGPKWCGKTSTAERHAKSALFMQNPDTIESNLRAADTKPSLLLAGEKPRLLDEWQVAPVLWDAVRFAVDRSEEDGLFILTGSAAIKDGQTKHTGTGRIARMPMRTMTLFESGESSGHVSLKSLFDEDLDIECISTLSIEKLAFALVRGGWPKAIGRQESIALIQVAEYVDATINTDASAIDGVTRTPARMRSLMRSLARNISTGASITTIRNDMRYEEKSLSEDTIISYLNTLNKLYVVEDLPSWNPSVRSKTSIRTSPVRHFVDPSIATAVLRLNSEALLKDFKTFGLLFESLCVRDLRVYAEANDGSVYHYRDAYGLEADAVVVLKDGRWGAIEVKMGNTEIEKGAANLLKLRETIDTEKMNQPSFLMVLTASDYAYKRKDGVLVTPIGCLKN